MWPGHDDCVFCCRSQYWYSRRAWMKGKNNIWEFIKAADKIIRFWLRWKYADQQGRQGRLKIKRHQGEIDCIHQLWEDDSTTLSRCSTDVLFRRRPRVIIYPRQKTEKKGKEKEREREWDRERDDITYVSFCFSFLPPWALDLFWKSRSANTCTQFITLVVKMNQLYSRR